MLILILGSIIYNLTIKEQEFELLTKLLDLCEQKIIASQTNNINEKKITVFNRNIYIFGDIDERITPAIIKSLKILDNKNSDKTINLYINSEIGTLNDVFAIIGIIETLKCKVNTIATGNCFGAGTILLSSGTGDRSATPNAIISLYMLSMTNNEKDKILERKRIASFWKRKSKIPSTWFNCSETKCYYLSPDEAMKYSIINNIIK
jgi:ATP-dependent protease ClpP protease subunit